MKVTYYEDEDSLVIRLSDKTVTREVSQGRHTHIGYTSDTVLGRLAWGERNGYLRWLEWNRHKAKGVGTLWAYCGVDCWSSRKARVTLAGRTSASAPQERKSGPEAALVSGEGGDSGVLGFKTRPRFPMPGRFARWPTGLK